MFSWISQPWVPPMTGQDEMVDILTEWKNSDKYCHTFAGASQNGSMYMLDMHPSDNGDTHNTWILFGDPSLMVRTDNPVSMNVTCTPSVLMLGMSELEVSAENTAYGIATLMMEGEVIASGSIFNGTCNLSFPQLNVVGTATLTVMGYNKVTEVRNIEVLPAEGPYITVANYTPNFAPVNMETNFTMVLKNVGVDPTNGNTNVTITSNDPRLSIIDGTEEFGVLNAEETVTLQDAFSFIIAEGVEDGTRFQIDVNMTDGRQTWSGRVIITAGQAILEYAGTEWAGSFAPGETLTFMTNFKNVGHYMATNAVATIVCESEYVTLLNTSVEIGTIDPEGIGTCVFNIQIDENCPETEQIPLNFLMQADGGLTAEGSITLRNSCNVIFELTDSYGDGWNGNMLNVSFSDGTPTQHLTIQSGSTASYIFEINNGVHVALSWTMGSWSSECSFIVRYEGGDVICQASDPNSSYSFEFDCNCAGGQTTNTYDPVENLTAEVGIGSITLTWDALEGAINYIIKRNGLEIGQTSEPIYTDEVFAEIYYTYCIIAEYTHGFSLPECIVIKSDLSVEENETEFAIYPNPVNNILYVNGGNAEYSYMMYNSMGQVVANGNAKGTEQISVEGMTKGIYFLRLTTGMQVLVEKVVVK
jgi:hypothetical protein